LSNKLLRTFCAAWLGLAYAACGITEQSGAEHGLAVTDEKDGEDIQVALSALRRASVVATHEDGVPSFIQGNLGRAEGPVSLLAEREAQARVQDALRGIAPVFRLRAEELVFRRMTVDELGHQHLRFTQTRNGRQVIGGEFILHVDREGTIYSANGSARDGEGASTQGARRELSVEAAAVAARNATSGVGLEARGTGREVYVRSSNGRLVKAHEVRVTGENEGLPLDNLVYVNAGSGEIELVNPQVHTAMSRRVHTANSGTSLPGTLLRGEGGAATGDTHVDMNYEHLGTTYNCYKTLFNRDSYNNAGAALTSTVHYSTHYVNAFWNGSQMVYGDGNGVDSGPLGQDLDVTVHELTHAVTSAESNLIYSNESGALNEGMSDIFAAVCESWTRAWSMDADVWKIGESIWTPDIAGDALRYMANPTQDGSSKDYYPERYTGTQDNGGVHWNSGIANLAFKLLATGGTHPRGKTTVNVPGIGVEKAGRIFYKANTDIFTSSTNFAQAKTGTEQAASQLGYDAATIAAVTKAWEAVGVGVAAPPPPTTTLSNGVPVSSLSDSSGGKKYYKLSVPSGQTSLKFTTSGGTGDVDLYVKFGAAPDTSTFDCRPYKSGNAEECTFTNPAAGDWYVMLNAYSTYSGVTLTGTYSGGGSGDTLTHGTATAPYSGGAGTWKCWTLTVPSGKTSVVFNQAGGTGDADLYVRFGSAPTLSTYACRPYLSGNTETCTISNPAAGTWYACSYGYSSYSNTTMKGTY
jgi:Zn-dependent metalloprotease